MYLLGCCRARRRRLSRVSWLLVALLLLVGSTWVTLLILQAEQVRLELHSEQRTISTADYDLFKSDNEITTHQPHHVPNSNNNNNNSRSSPLTNGRQPKGIDLTELTNENNTEHAKETNSTHNATHENTDQITLDLSPTLNLPNSLQLLRNKLTNLSQQQTIYNADKFPPLASDGIVFIVQAHRRIGYLKLLFDSMRMVKGIEKILLVISHDYYFDDMMDLVKTVDFCKVTQIFYPFSLQVYPDRFPGTSKDDCPRDITQEEARAKNCTNAHHPDTYGHYREAQVTATKHHWWWKANMIFDGMNATRNFSGYVIFLEEDHYLSPDFLYMTEKLIEMKNSRCDECDFINVGMYTSKVTSNMAHRVSIGIWISGKNNMGFGMNRKKWNQIKSCKEQFCTYDDYNWDWTLESIGRSCYDRPLKVLVTKIPRIYHIGRCGVHHTKECDEKKDGEKVANKINSLRESLFPEELHLDDGLFPPPPRKKLKPYGGWGDSRDHNLCLSFVENPLQRYLPPTL